ncbi:MAG: sensor histidine kinase, partial [Chloroflexi bacterium]|nr:sensor histidine kinase [Chloroflexota bacterium]
MNRGLATPLERLALAQPQAQRYASQFRQHLRDRRFWVVQALAIAISIFHTALEAARHPEWPPALYLAPVSVYFVPTIYAALNFGLEGAVPTALWCWVLAVPDIVLFHGGAERLGINLQLAIMLIVAALVARRVDREVSAKFRAQAASQRLAEINTAAAVVCRSLVLSEVVTATLAAVLRHAGVSTAWIAYAPEDWATSTVAAMAGVPPREIALPLEWQEATRRVIGQGFSPPGNWAETGHGSASNVAIIPIEASASIIGALGVVNAGDCITADDAELFTAIARQLGIAMENIRHYQQAKQTLADLARAQTDLETYIRLATDALEEERRHMARDLHDDTIQSLVIIKGRLETISAMDLSRPFDRSRLEEVKDMLARTIIDVRRFSQDLRPSMLDDLGLAHAVESMVADFESRTGIRCTLSVVGTPRRLSSRVEVAIYRIVQEALRNVEKHSRAGHAQVTLTFSADAITAAVIDDGHGFATSEVLARPSASSSLGIRGMQERAKLIGGVLNIRSGSEEGTAIEVR